MSSPVKILPNHDIVWVSSYSLLHTPNVKNKNIYGMRKQGVMQLREQVTFSSNDSTAITFMHECNAVHEDTQQ